MHVIAGTIGALAAILAYLATRARPDERLGHWHPYSFHAQHGPPRAH